MAGHSIPNFRLLVNRRSTGGGWRLGTCPHSLLVSAGTSVHYHLGPWSWIALAALLWYLGLAQVACRSPRWGRFYHLTVLGAGEACVLPGGLACDLGNRFWSRGIILSRNSGGKGSLVSASHSMVSSCSHSEVLCRQTDGFDSLFFQRPEERWGSRSCESTINGSKNSNFLLSE